jgi:hypothetical protein
MVFVLEARKYAAQTAESAEMRSEFERVSALFAISAAYSLQLHQDGAPNVEECCARPQRGINRR